MREYEPRLVKSQRAKMVSEFDLAERVLNVGYALVTGTTVKHPGDDALVGRILLGLYGKILANLWCIIVLSERVLPTSAVMRSLVEALIGMRYIATTDSTNRATLYRDALFLRAEKDLNRRKNSPEDRDTVTPEEERQLAEIIAKIVAERGQEVVEDMKGWKTWAGKDKSIEQMAKEGGLPSTVYNIGYAHDSRGTHAMDSAEFLKETDEGLQIQVSGQLLSHLMPAVGASIVAMETVNSQFKLGREKTVTALHDDLMKLVAERRTKGKPTTRKGETSE